MAKRRTSSRQELRAHWRTKADLAIVQPMLDRDRAVMGRAFGDSLAPVTVSCSPRRRRRRTVRAGRAGSSDHDHAGRRSDAGGLQRQARRGSKVLGVRPTVAGANSRARVAAGHPRLAVRASISGHQQSQRRRPRRTERRTIRAYPVGPSSRSRRLPAIRRRWITRSRCCPNVPTCSIRFRVSPRWPGPSHSWRWVAIVKAVAGEAAARGAEPEPAVVRGGTGWRRRRWSRWSGRRRRPRRTEPRRCWRRSRWRRPGGWSWRFRARARPGLRGATVYSAEAGALGRYLVARGGYALVGGVIDAQVARRRARGRVHETDVVDARAGARPIGSARWSRTEK